jgi:anthranilate synthase component 1
VYCPSKEEFLKKATQGNLIPVYKEVLADMETPVSAFRKLQESDYAFLLESVEKGETLGRYSFLGAEPSIVFKSKANEINLLYQKAEDEFFTNDAPLQSLREIMQRYQPVVDPDLPPFFGGAVGYIGYDAVRNFEKLPDLSPDDLNLPDCFFMITDTIVIFDHVKHRMLIASNAHIRDNPEEAYDRAVHQIEVLYSRLKRMSKAPERTFTDIDRVVDSNVQKEKFEEAVRRCKEYILSGDIFQVVISQRLQTAIQCDPFDIYRALRAINPSPYMFYLQLGNLKIAGSSPEILVKLTDGKVQIRPIAGTRPRGATRLEDAALERELLADPKELAEHIMLVDLGRNDCGRVAEFGSVRVDDLKTIERYSHVMHIVSNVEGTLRKGLDAYDVLRACFPAGTVTGAPKIRAMEIIEELEPVKRGPYAGAVGYFSFSGNLDTCITIRTIIMKDEIAYVQAGAGIVADSVPENEYHETMNKARAMLRAIDMAERGLE